ncbi:MAG: bifunctional 4-hydroxy-2-oxoglutarate aldolase/2-dehydro-3-deoxy-phosphogluconate aldolase [Oscillospiraceae bacterium]
MKQTIISQIERERIIVIVRRIYGEQLEKLFESLHEGGLRMVEVTFDQSDPDCLVHTADAIARLNKRFGSDSLIGAGTVLTPAQADAAFNAGAQYIISPNTDPDVIARTLEHGLVSIPGAMTPSEILAAHKCGADIVKVFPAIDLGLSYVKNIRGPISHVKLLATAGVNEENLKDFLNGGYIGAGISGRLTDRKVLESGNYSEFTERAKTFRDIVSAFNEGR